MEENSKDVMKISALCGGICSVLTSLEKSMELHAQTGRLRGTLDGALLVKTAVTCIESLRTLQQELSAELEKE